MRSLVLTFDYELFGDGSGNVFEHMVEPTDHILNICAEHNIKTTIFFEVVEYWRLKEEWEKENAMGYNRNPVKAIEQQLQKAAQNGHDIQLHLHPQWVNAEWVNGSWQMDMNNWRLGDFSVEEDYTIKDLLSAGKETIDNLIQEVKPGYECTALRAGAYNIMPSQKVYDAMKATGLKMDSSVYPGGYEQGELSKYDYRDVPLLQDYWWVNSADIRRENSKEKKIMEIPVFSLQQRRIHKLLNWDKIKALLFGNRGVSSVAKEKVSKRSFIQNIKFLFEKEAFTWDFCLFSNYLHQQFFQYIETELTDHRNTFVIIGHPKSYQSSRSLNSLIKQVNASTMDYNFKTLKQVYEGFRN